MDFLVQLQNAVGREPKKDILRNFVNALIDKRFQIVGHKISQFEDTRYTVLRDFVKNHVPNDPEIKVIKIQKSYKSYQSCINRFHHRESSEKPNLFYL